MADENTSLPELQRLAALEIIKGSGGGGPTTADQGAPGSDPWPVTGPVTNAQLTAVTGTAASAAWPGFGAGTEISVLKAIYTQLVTANATLATIATNTTPAG